MAKAVAMRINNAGRNDAGKVAKRASGRSVKTILVVGLSLPTMRALARLVGKHFYIEKVADATECIQRVRGDEQIGGIVVDPGLSEFDARTFTVLLRKYRPELPLFFYVAAQEVSSVSANTESGITQYFVNPSEICKLAEAIVVQLTDGTVRPLLWHPKDTLVSRALEFIEANYRTIRRVEDISSHVGVSREHLSRQFTRFAGHKLSEFVNILRIEKAKELLIEGGLVKQVFSQVGFRCNSSFFKAFLKHTGIAPSVYRDTMLAKKQARRMRGSGRGSFDRSVAR
jgi:AraC-like DNA-binding protein/CheY-like chemotaxis protein